MTPATRLPRAGQRTPAPLPWLGAIRRSRQQHSFWHAFHAARGAQLAFPSARNVPMPEKQPPAFRSVQPAARHHTAGGATRDRTRTPRTGGRGISQSDQPRRAARPHSCEQRGPASARACHSFVPLPLPSQAWCPPLATSTAAEEWIPLIDETPAPAAGRAYEYCSCNKLRTREEGANAAQQSAARGCPTRNVHSTAPNARNWSLGSCR